MTRCLAQSVHLGSSQFISVHLSSCLFIFVHLFSARHIPISEVGQICAGYPCCAHVRLQPNARPDSGILGKFRGSYWLSCRRDHCTVCKFSCVDILAPCCRQCQNRRHFFVSSYGERWLCRRHPKRGRCGDYGLNHVEFDFWIFLANGGNMIFVYPCGLSSCIYIRYQYLLMYLHTARYLRWFAKSSIIVVREGIGLKKSDAYPNVPVNLGTAHNIFYLSQYHPLSSINVPFFPSSEIQIHYPNCAQI